MKQKIAPVRKDKPHPAQIVDRQMIIDCRFCRTRAPKVCTAIAMVKKPPEKVPMAINTAKMTNVGKSRIAQYVVAYPAQDKGGLFRGDVKTVNLNKL